MSTPRDGGAATALAGKIYAMGGDMVTGHESWDTLKTVEMYDPASNTWAPRADMGRAEDAFSALDVGGRILTVGGFVPYGEMYDPATDTWTTTSSIPSQRIGAAAAVVNGKVYVFGGAEKGGGPATSKVFEHDPETDSWAALAPMPFAGLGLSASVVDGNVYIIRGSEESYPHKPPHRSTVWEHAPEL
jgi:N-acetylneuraminic acid mutarotase